MERKKEKGTWDEAGERSRGSVMQGLVKVRSLDFVLKATGNLGRDLSNRVTRSDLLLKAITGFREVSGALADHCNHQGKR